MIDLHAALNQFAYEHPNDPMIPVAAEIVERMGVSPVFERWERIRLDRPNVSVEADDLAERLREHRAGAVEELEALLPQKGLLAVEDDRHHVRTWIWAILRHEPCCPEAARLVRAAGTIEWHEFRILQVIQYEELAVAVRRCPNPGETAAAILDILHVAGEVPEWNDPMAALDSFLQALGVGKDGVPGEMSYMMTRYADSIRYTEIDWQRYDQRIVDEHPDGAREYANATHRSERCRLGLTPFPDLVYLETHGPKGATYAPITRDEFEQQWRAAGGPVS
ncbi:MAG TPA: hypothetical protein VGM88_27275 [Kofleriaceae bacterium]